MNVIFIEPSFPYNQREFVRGLHAAGANVIGIGERSASELSRELRHRLADYVRVPSVVCTSRRSSKPCRRSRASSGWIGSKRPSRRISCRPPGVGQWDDYNAANEFDLYFEWATAIVRGQVMTPPTRRYSAGMIALRPECDGDITANSGVDEIHHRYGNCVVAAHLPDPGTPTQAVDAGYMANAWMRIRHPDYDELRRFLDEVGETVRVHAA